MDTLASMKLNVVDIEDIEEETVECSFFVDYNNIDENNPYDMVLKLISEKVEVIDYDKNSNVAILDLTGFVCNNINVIDELLNIPAHDPEDEYLNIIVGMINGYEGKPYYEAFMNAYKENKFVTSNADIKEIVNDEEERGN